MIGTIFRYASLGALASLIVLAVLIFDPGVRRTQAAFEACAAAPSSDCLVDLGVAEAAHSSVSLSGYIDEIALLGKIEAAYVLALEQDIFRSETPEAFVIRANNDVAHYRLAAAIRAGDTLAQAMPKVPALDTLRLFFTAHLLLGSRSFGWDVGPPPDAHVMAAVRGIVAELQRRALDPALGSVPLTLRYVAELGLALDDPALTRAALAAIPAEDAARSHLDAELMRVFGVDAALRRFGIDPDRRASSLEQAAIAAPARSGPFLAEAFAIRAQRDRWPDASGMLRIVTRAVTAGQDDLALQLARQMPALVAESASPFVYSHHIDAASALRVAGAADAEVRAEMTLAQAAFPDEDNAVVAIGLNAGPMRWSGFGLKDLAITGLAQNAARLGDMDGVEDLLSQLEVPMKGWRDLLGADLTPAQFDGILAAAASADLPDDAVMVLRWTQAGRWLSMSEDEALKELAAAILSDPSVHGEDATVTSAGRLRAAQYLGDAAGQESALKALAGLALEGRNPRDLVTAGIAWHRAGR